MAHAIRIPQTNSWNMIRLSVLAVFHTAQGTMGFSTLMVFSFFCFKPFQKPWFLWHMSWCSKVWDRFQQNEPPTDFKQSVVCNLSEVCQPKWKVSARFPSVIPKISNLSGIGRRLGKTGESQDLSGFFHGEWIEWFSYTNGWLVDFYLYLELTPGNTVPPYTTPFHHLHFRRPSASVAPRLHDVPVTVTAMAKLFEEVFQPGGHSRPLIGSSLKMFEEPRNHIFFVFHGGEFKNPGFINPHL